MWMAPIVAMEQDSWNGKVHRIYHTINLAKRLYVITLSAARDFMLELVAIKPRINHRSKIVWGHINSIRLFIYNCKI